MSAPTTRPQRLTLDRSYDYVLASIFAFLVAQGSVIYTCYWIGHTEGIRESGGMLADLPYTLDGLHIVITFCLGLCFVGLWSRRTWGLVISLVALAVLVATYGRWRLMTVKYLSELRNNPQLYRRVQQEVGWFHGASNWDLIVLALATALLLWQLFKLTKMIQERRRPSPEG